MPKPPRPPANPLGDPLATMRRQFQIAMEHAQMWRKEAEIDVKWCAGVDGDRSYQWPAVVQQARDLEQRPFETINRLPSFIKQVTNQQRQAGPMMQVVPLKGAKSQQDAEAREGLLRHSMLISEGEVQIDTAFEDMATCGKGFVEVVNRYVEDDDSDEQDLFVEWRDPFTVFIDPAATKLDKSDMKFAFIPYDMPAEEYNALYPQSSVAQMGQASWAGLSQDDRQRWFPEGCVRVARMYELVYEDTPTKTKPGGQRTLKRRHVVKRMVNALEVLEESVMTNPTTKIPLKRIPIVPMLGDRFLINGKEDYRGMVRLARGPQQMLNFWITALTETIALATKAPWLVEWSQMEGLESFWNQANKINLPYLPWRASNNGQPGVTAPPQRITGEPPIQAITVAIKIANDSLQQVMNLYDPSLGKAHPDQSGRAINALQQQGEIGNSNYIDNLKRFYRSLGRLLLQMYAVYYDTPRVRRIIGTDGHSKTIVVHSANEPTQADLDDLEEEIGADSIFDLSEMQYDIVVSTGPSFLSRRQEANANMLEIWKMLPALIPIMLPTFLDNSDFAGSRELADLCRKTISAPFQQNGDQDAQQQLAKAKQLLQGFAQQHDLLVKELQAKTDYIKTEQAKYGAQVQMKDIEARIQLRLQELKNAASIAVAEINAQTKGVVSQNELQHEQFALGAAQAHEAVQAELDRQHELGMAHVEAAQAADQSAQDHSQQLEQIAAQPEPAPAESAPESE